MPEGKNYRLPNERSISTIISFRDNRYTGEPITLFPISADAGIVTLDYVVKMALDSSFRRGEVSETQQDGEDTDEFMRARAPAIRTTGSGISVTLWDEVEPCVPRTTTPLADDSPET